MIIEKLNTMFEKSTGQGANPFVVNFISFCGHGITLENESIALIPGTKYIDGLEVNYIYPLNLSYWARKFS